MSTSSTDERVHNMHAAVCAERLVILHELVGFINCHVAKIHSTIRNLAASIVSAKNVDCCFDTVGKLDTLGSCRHGTP